MSVPVLSSQQVRRLAITRQQLTGPRPKPTPAAMLNVVREIGCLQLDPISAVARSHTLVLFSRLGPYDLADFDTLMWKDRSLFEYWAHVASIVLTEDYPIHRMMMRDFEQGNGTWGRRIQDWITKNSALRDRILFELREKGPLPSRFIENDADENWKSSGWSNDRNVSRMLDFLWLRGDIMVAQRKGGQKFWDISQRCLPDWVSRELSNEEIVRHATLRAIRALGVANDAMIRSHFTRGRYPGLKNALKELEQQGIIQQVKIEQDKRVFYVHCEDVPLLDQLEQDWQPRTTLLSPFDNLICDRARTEFLFNFFFRIEIYVPKPKRQYGYYVLPILHGDRLIGRIDPTMNRKEGRLEINNVYAEADAPMNKPTARAIGKAVEDLARFLGAKDIAYTENVPDKWKTSLRSS